MKKRNPTRKDFSYAPRCPDVRCEGRLDRPRRSRSGHKATAQCLECRRRFPVEYRSSMRDVITPELVKKTMNARVRVP